MLKAEIVLIRFGGASPTRNNDVIPLFRRKGFICSRALLSVHKAGNRRKALSDFSTSYSVVFAVVGVDGA